MAKTLDVARWARFFVVARRPAVFLDDIFIKLQARYERGLVHGQQKKKYLVISSENREINSTADSPTLNFVLSLTQYYDYLPIPLYVYKDVQSVYVGMCSKTIKK